MLIAYREQVIEFLRRSGATKVIFLGFLARGDHNETSDNDLIVDRLDDDTYRCSG